MFEASSELASVMEFGFNSETGLLSWKHVTFMYWTVSPYGCVQFQFEFCSLLSCVGFTEHVAFCARDVQSQTDVQIGHVTRLCMRVWRARKGAVCKGVVRAGLTH